MADDKSLVPQDQIELELQKAQLKVDRERNTTIGNLLDKAADVLSTVLDSDDPAMQNARMRAAEVAINLYVQQDNGRRQERALELQKRRLDLEEEKMRQPGGPLFQQNNVYVQQGAAPAGAVEDSQAALLARKTAQDKLLSSLLPPKKEEEVIDVPENTANEDGEAVLSTDTDEPTGDNK